MKKYKISFCSLECAGARYFTDIRFGTLTAAKKVMNALSKENYDVALYRLKKDGKTDLDYEFLEIGKNSLTQKIR